MLDLLRKDFLITKKMWALVFVIVWFIPLLFAFAGEGKQLPAGVVLSSSNTLLCLMLLLNIYEEESRFPKAAALMVSIGYRRKTQIIARYVLIVGFFIICTAIYTLETFFVEGLLLPKVVDIVAAFFIYGCIASLYVALVTKYGLAVGRYILLFVILSTSLGPTILTKLPIHIDWQRVIHYLTQLNTNTFMALLMAVVLLCMACSITFAVRAYEKKEL